MSQVSTPQSKLYTARDIERLDAQGHRYELVAGELLPMSPTSPPHGRDTGRLTIALGNFIESNNLGELFVGETGFRLTTKPDTVLAPDIAFVRSDRIALLGNKGFGKCAPDLVVEIRSPGDTKREVSDKLRRWLGFGVRLVLDLDPKAKRLTVHRPGHEAVVLGPGDTLGGYDVLPGFTMPLSRVFR